MWDYDCTIWYVHVYLYIHTHAHEHVHTCVFAENKVLHVIKLLLETAIILIRVKSYSYLSHSHPLSDQRNGLIAPQPPHTPSPLREDRRNDSSELLPKLHEAGVITAQVLNAARIKKAV